MSDTPRTAAATKTYVWNGVKHVFVDAIVAQQLAAERDDARHHSKLCSEGWENMNKAKNKLTADLSASQQEARMLREALEKCSTCLDWFARNKPDDIGLDDQEAMELSAAALTSTPASVISDADTRALSDLLQDCLALFVEVAEDDDHEYFEIDQSLRKKLDALCVKIKAAI